MENESPLEAAWSFYGGEDIPAHHGWVKVKCAVHDESRPSASVNLERGKWTCYAGCGHGDVYDLIGLKEGLTEFLDQKRFAQEHGWFVEDEHPEPSPMNPRPRTHKRKKGTWKPAWL